MPTPLSLPRLLDVQYLQKCQTTRLRPWRLTYREPYLSHMSLVCLSFSPGSIIQTPYDPRLEYVTYCFGTRIMAFVEPRRVLQRTNVLGVWGSLAKLLQRG